MPPTDDDAALRAWLRTHEEPCPACRYSLLGVTATTCPECGAGLRLAVASPGAAIGPWALGVISFALALGFDGVVLLLLGVGFTIAFVTEGRSIGTEGPAILLFLSPLILMGLASAVGLWWFFARRRVWASIDRQRQWKIAVAIFIMVGVVHALGGVVMMALSPR